MGDDGDLVSLRLFLVAPEAQQELRREATTMASMPIQFEAGDASSAKVAFGRGAVDICVLDESVSEADRASLVKAARRSKPSPSLFLSCARSGRSEGVANVFGRPRNAAEAGKLIEICIRLKSPTPVLVVDDSDTTRRPVRKILAASRFDWTSMKPPDSASALNDLRVGNSGVVFLDYDMPGLNGADILDGIKRLRPDTAIAMNGLKGADRPRRKAAYCRHAGLAEKAVLSRRRGCRHRALSRLARAALIGLRVVYCRDRSSENSPLRMRSPSLSAKLAAASSP